MKDVLDFLTKKERKRLATLDFETKKTFEQMTRSILHAFAIEFSILEEKYMQEKQDMMIIAIAYVLNQGYKFGKKRLPEVVNDMWVTYEMIENGELKIEECAELLKEHGIIVKTQSIESLKEFKELKEFGSLNYEEVKGDKNE